MFKIFDSANKLFEMVRGRPVGVMIYAAAGMNGVPWETLIKDYRDRRSGLCFSHLAEYAFDFLSYLNTTQLVDRQSEESALSVHAYETFLWIVDVIDGQLATVLTQSGRLVKSQFKDLLNMILNSLEAGLRSAPVGWPGISAREIKDQHGDLLGAIVDGLFSEFPILTSQRNRMVDLAIVAFQRAIPRAEDSGVVVAGFGEDDPFPSLVSLTVQGRFLGGVRVPDWEVLQVTATRAGDFRTFAQDAQALQQLTGVHEAVRSEIMKHWAEFESQLASQIEADIRQHHPRLSDATIASICALEQTRLSERIQVFADDMNKFQDDTFLSPMRASVAFLPKDDLAMFAESMVNMTRIYQRVNITSSRTVGGEIDLAVISRGDGFVWLSRKHYFNLDLNPAWPVTHAGTIPTREEA